MLFETPTQWAVLVLCLLLGWVLGLLSRSGGAKYRHELAAEQKAHAAYRTDAEARIATANKRIGELESRAPLAAGTGGSIAAAASGNRDDLSLIRGIGRSGETRLNEFGIHSYRDIEAMTAADEAALEGRMGAEPGYIGRERWREQAELLRTGRATVTGRGSPSSDGIGPV